VIPADEYLKSKLIFWLLLITTAVAYLDLLFPLKGLDRLIKVLKDFGVMTDIRFLHFYKK
jgi:hypothetical protein